MQLAGQAEVGALDVVLAGLARDAEQLVKIFHVGHSQLTLPVPVPSLSAWPKRLLTTATAARACS